MHIRPRPWARPELEASSFFAAEPWTLKNHWRERFPAPAHPLYLELGCGKGHFIAKMSAAHPENNYLAVDMIDTMLGITRRNVVAERGGADPENLTLTAWDITRIDKILGPDDRIDGLYINFCNPWPKRKKHKKRLTHTRQLILYKAFLAPGAVLRFKTDDDGLFDDTLDYLKEAGFETETVIRNLHAHPVADDYPTEHEKMFAAKGIPIKYLQARMI
jgi:tRNA (guanine-N7-)-methyltransferase